MFFICNMVYIPGGDSPRPFIQLMVVVFFIISSGGAQNYRDLQDNFFLLVL